MNRTKQNGNERKNYKKDSKSRYSGAPTNKSVESDTRRHNDKYPRQRILDTQKETIPECIYDLNCSICSCVKKTNNNMYPCEHGLCDPCNIIVKKIFSNNCPICITVYEAYNRK